MRYSAGILSVFVACITASASAGTTALAQVPTNASWHPIKKVNGSGSLPDGWRLRFDELPGKQFSIRDVSFTHRADSALIESGPAAIYYRDSDSVAGTYTVRAVFTQPKTIGHEAYGIFVGGSNLQDSTIYYLYFVIRTQGRAFLIRERQGNDSLVTIVRWTPTPAVREEAGRLGWATNALEIAVGMDSVTFHINGARVHAEAVGRFSHARPSGIVGLRVNHNIAIAVTGFGFHRR